MLVYLVMHRSPEQISKMYDNIEACMTYSMNLCMGIHSKTSDSLSKHKIKN
jgi:hypothetical protein